jgi:hypothetical protein
MDVTIVQSDLLDQDVDVIVNAWNRNLIPWWLLWPHRASAAIKCRAGNGPFQELGRRLLPLVDEFRNGILRLQRGSWSTRFGTRLNRRLGSRRPLRRRTGPARKRAPSQRTLRPPLHRAKCTYRITSRICELSQAFDAKRGPSGIVWPDCTPFCAPKKPKKSPKMYRVRAFVRDLRY